MSSQAGSSISGTVRIIEGPSNPDWANLPNDVLALIVTMLGTMTDVCHFGAVCRSWYRAALEDRPNRRMVENNQRPLLMVPILSETKGSGTWSNARGGIPQETTLDIDKDMRSCGSSHGWLIRMNVKSTWFTFINPASGVYIDLPELMKDAMDLEYGDGDDHDDNAAANDYEKFFITKAVLSADPLFHLDDFTMMVIFGNICRLALYISCTNSWTFLDHPFKDLHDAIFYKGKFYLVDIDSSVYSCDIDDPVLVEVVGPPPEQPEIGCRSYLVESPEGNLLQVWRLLLEDEEAPTRPFETKGFRIFKLVNQEGQSELVWEAVKGLEGVALYLGDNHGISVKAADYPGCVEENSVYFTTECIDMSKTGWREPCVPFDNGRYSLKDDTIIWNGICEERDKNWPPPIWIIPTLPEEGLDL